MPEFKQQLSDPDKTVKEVWADKGIETRTELNPKQIQSINLSQTLARIFGGELLNTHINHFLRLQKSKDRKSMKEFVEAFRSKKDERAEKASGFQLLG